MIGLIVCAIVFIIYEINLCTTEILQSLNKDRLQNHELGCGSIHALLSNRK